MVCCFSESSKFCERLDWGRRSPQREFQLLRAFSHFPPPKESRVTVEFWLWWSWQRTKVLKTVTTSVFLQRFNASRQMCVNSVSHAWIWFNLFRSLFWYLMWAFPWVKLRTTTGPWRTSPVCSRGELKCRGHSLYPRWNLKKARSLKWWPLTHSSQQWQTKERG